MKKYSEADNSIIIVSSGGKSILRTVSFFFFFLLFFFFFSFLFLWRITNEIYFEKKIEGKKNKNQTKNLIKFYITYP